ncbi:MAG: hypothetical protein AAB556_00420 [Patescibacteria group bacterium]
MSNRIRVYSDISRDIAQVVFASVFVGPLIGGTASYFSFGLGIFISFSAWYFSVALIKN